MTDGRALRWEWSTAVLGLVYAVPAGLVAYGDVSRGAAFAVGVIPAAILGLAPTRRLRLRTCALGIMTGVPLILGSAVSNSAVLAVAAIFVLAVGTVVLARAAPIGSIVLVLSLPMAGVGLSYAELRDSLGLALVLIGGSIYAAAASMMWPENRSASAPADRQVSETPSLDYGVRLGAAAAIAAASGFAFGLEHVGWATAAVLLVMRPGTEQTTRRMAGRIASVLVGGAAAWVLVAMESTALVYSLAVVLCVACAGATHASRWYITPTFTTFLVLLLLVAPEPGAAGYRFTERLTETLLGVGLAWIFGVALPGVLGSGPVSGERSTPPRRRRP